MLKNYYAVLLRSVGWCVAVRAMLACCPVWQPGEEGEEGANVGHVLISRTAGRATVQQYTSGPAACRTRHHTHPRYSLLLLTYTVATQSNAHIVQFDQLLVQRKMFSLLSSRLHSDSILFCSPSLCFGHAISLSEKVSLSKF